MSSTWEKVMGLSPTMKAVVEDKITVEVGKKQVEIDTLKSKLEQAESDNITALLALTEVYEQLLAIQGGGV